MGVDVSGFVMQIKEKPTPEECLLMKEQYEVKLKSLEGQHKEEIEFLKKKIKKLQKQLKP